MRGRRRVRIEKDLHQIRHLHWEVLGLLQISRCWLMEEEVMQLIFLLAHHCWQVEATKPIPHQTNHSALEDQKWLQTYPFLCHVLVVQDLIIHHHQTHNLSLLLVVQLVSQEQVYFSCQKTNQQKHLHSFPKSLVYQVVANYFLVEVALVLEALREEHLWQTHLRNLLNSFLLGVAFLPCQTFLSRSFIEGLVSFACFTTYRGFVAFHTFVITTIIIIVLIPFTAFASLPFASLP